MAKAETEIKMTLDGSFIMDTDAGPVHTINSDFVSDKALSLIKTILNMFNKDGHGLASIVFRNDGYPQLDPEKLTTWGYFPDAQAAVCNLRDVVENAFTITRRDKDERTMFIAIKTLIWKGLIEGLGHEIHHCHVLAADRTLLKADGTVKDEEEAEAQQYAEELFVKLAQRVDIEPDLGPELERIFREFWEVEATEAEKSEDKRDKKWLELQSTMLDNGWAFHVDKDPKLDGKSVTLETIKEYIMFIEGANPEDDDWKTETTGIIQEVHRSGPKPVYTDAEAVLVAQGNADMLSDDEMMEEAMAMQEFPDGMAGTANFGPAQTQGFQTPQFQQPIQGAWTPPQQATPQATAQGAWTPPAQQNQSTQAPVGSMPAGFTPPAAVAQSPAAVGTGTYPPHQLDMQKILRVFYEKCFVQLFTGCGWDGVTFTNKDAIRQPIQITPDENTIIRHMVAQDEHGTYNTYEVQGSVSGKFMDREQLMPGFELTLAMPDGTAVIRKLLPQNPNKQSKPAELTRQGWCIMWIIDPDNNDPNNKKPGVRLAYVPNQGVFLQQYNIGTKSWANVC